MCLGKCFEKGACAKTLPGEVRFSADGLRLYHRTGKHGEFRSFFKGDAEWVVNSDGGVAVTEYHNIELICLSELVRSSAIDNTDLTKVCRKKLNNSHIYSALVRERVKALIRRGWVKDLGYCYKLTSKGLKAAAEALVNRHKF